MACGYSVDISTVTPQNPCWVDVHFIAPFCQRFVNGLNIEDAARAVKVSDIARQNTIPCVVSNPAIQRFVEEKRSNRRNSNAALMARQALTSSPAVCKCDIATVTTETLFAEVLERPLL